MQRIVFKRFLNYIFFVAAFLLLILFFVFPLGRLLSQPFFGNDDITELFSILVENSSNWQSLKNTFIFAGAVTFFSALIGWPLAWLVTRTPLVAAKKFKTLLSLPYAIPPFIGAIAWIYLANPNQGLLNQWLGEGTINIYSMPGLIFVETCFLYTFIFLAVCSALEQMDSSLEEAARTSGASPFHIFFKITLPLVRPALVNSCLLVFLAASASFGVPALIGGPGNVRVLTTEIYQLQRMGTTKGLQMSILLSSLLLIFSVILILVSSHLMRKNKYSLVSGKSSRANLLHIGRFRHLFLLLTIVVVIIALGLPFMGVLLSATSQIQGTLGLSNFTFNHFVRVLFETEELGRAFKNSLLLGFIVSTICSVLALIYGYITTQTKSRFRPFIDIFISLPYAAPGTVIALALIITFSQNFFGIPISIYNTLGLFVLAYTMKFMNFSFKLIADNYRQVHPHLIEAAQTSGAGTARVIRHIWIPLLRPALMASFFLVFVPALTELTMSVFLTGPGLETIGTLIFQMQEYSDNIGGGASALSTLIFIFVVLMNSLVKKISKGQYGL